MKYEGARLVANENFILREIAGNKVLISVGAGVADFRGYIQMNESACFMWEELKKGATVGELQQAFVERYQIPEEQAAADIEETIDTLLQHKMVTVCSR